MNTVGRACKTTVLAGLVLAVTVLAQSSSGTIPANTPPPNAPTAEPAPGTTPVGGDIPAAAPSATSSTKTAPGITPASGKVPVVNVNPDKVIEPGSQWAGVKTGSIDDVNAVGDRDIGNRGWSNWYSNDTEIKMGRM